MTAPSVVYIESTTAGSSTALPSSTITSPAIGDLAVVVQNGTQNATAWDNPPVSYTTGGGTAGYTVLAQVNSGAGEGKVEVAAKILTSGDFTGSNFKQLTSANTGGNFTAFRTQLYIFRHASGWEAVNTQTAYTDIAGFTANTNQSVTASSTRPNVAVFAWAAQTAQNTLTMKWDSGTAREPYCGNATTDTGYPQTVTSGGHTSTTHFHTSEGRAQSDYNEYDTGTGPATFQNNVGVSNAHAIVIGFFQTTTNTVTGTATFAGGGSRLATSTVTHIATVCTFAGGGTRLATSTVTHVATACTFNGGGSRLAAQQGVAAITGTGTFAGGGTFVARQAVTGTGTFAGGATFGATGTRTHTATATFAGGGTRHADQQLIELGLGGAGEWAAGSVQILGGDTWTATATFAGGGSRLATGHKLIVGAGLGTFVGGGTRHANGTRIVLAVATFTGGATFTASQNFVGINPKTIVFEHKSQLVLNHASTLVLET